MNNPSDILDRIGGKDGMTVPEGYFADFASRMASSLPERKAAPAPRRTLWMRVRPYAYMAAMFAGIWCMMKMFSLMRNTDADLSIDNYPGVITALNDESFVKDYVYPDIDSYDVLDDLYNSGLSPDDIFTDEDGYYDQPSDILN